MATDTYVDQKLSDLPSTTADIEHLGQILTDPGIGGYSVREIHNDRVFDVNLALEEFFVEAGFEDVLFLYLSGHGIKDDMGRLFFAARDTRLDRLASSAISSGFVHDLIGHSLAKRVVVILDCCYAGAFSRDRSRRSRDNIDVLERLSAPGRAILASSTALQYSFEAESDPSEGTARPSVFTQRLIAGLRSGDADMDGDGLVEVSELYRYIYRELHSSKVAQTPVFSSDLEGPFYVAYAPLSRPPATVPQGDDLHPLPTLGPPSEANSLSIIMDSTGGLEMLVGRRRFLVGGSALLITPKQIRIGDGRRRWVLDLATLADHHREFAKFVKINWPEIGLAQPADASETDWIMSLPGDNAFGGSLVTVQINGYTEVEPSALGISGKQIGRIERFIRSPHQGIVVISELQGNGGIKFLGISKAEARQQIRRRRRLSIPKAYVLDDLTYGVVWAATNLDEALQTDEITLAESRRRLSSYGALPGSAVSREVTSDLTTVSQMWLGSDFCARYIVERLEGWSDSPLYWTREKSGEEACMWLLVKHKYDYLRKTGRRFTGADPALRVFCIPPEELEAAHTYDRVLIFLAVALMEMLGIEIRLCADPGYLEVEGFVLDSKRRGMIANWVRGQGIWHVDSLGRGSKVNEFNDAVRFTLDQSAIVGSSVPERLLSFSHYLELNWDWLVARCREMGELGWAGLVRPRSRLLGVDALNAVCRFVGEIK